MGAPPLLGRKSPSDPELKQSSHLDPVLGDQRSPQFAGSSMNRHQNFVEVPGGDASRNGKRTLLSPRTSRMNETNGGAVGMQNKQGIQAAIEKVGLATQQEFGTEQAFKASANNPNGNIFLDDNSRTEDGRGEKLPMISRKSPGTKNVRTSGVRGSNEMNSARASQRQGHSTDNPKNRIVTINQDQTGTPRVNDKEL